jgi:hypothetical protein
VLLCPLLFWLVRGPFRMKVMVPALVFLGFAVAVGPWAVRNTKLQGVPTVIDTMGGMNLRLGNYEFTPDDRMWDAIAQTGERSWSHQLDIEQPGKRHTEGEKDKWAQAKAFAYMRAHPGETIRRSFIKLADFWGIEREFIAGVRQGMFRISPSLASALAGGIALAYVGVALLGVAGLWLARPEWRLHVLVLLPALAITGGHLLAFGHSRYHLPLVPFLGLYAANLLTRGTAAWRLSSPVVRTAATLSVAILVAIWVRQVVLVDAARIRSVFGDAN